MAGTEQQSAWGELGAWYVKGTPRVMVSSRKMQDASTRPAHCQSQQVNKSAVDSRVDMQPDGWPACRND